jgi:hypothetical protein
MTMMMMLMMVVMVVVVGGEGGDFPPFRVKNHVMSLSSPPNTC